MNRDKANRRDLSAERGLSKPHGRMRTGVSVPWKGGGQYLLDFMVQIYEKTCRNTSPASPAEIKRLPAWNKGDYSKLLYANAIIETTHGGIQTLSLSTRAVEAVRRYLKKYPPIEFTIHYVTVNLMAPDPVIEVVSEGEVPPPVVVGITIPIIVRSS